MCIRDTSFYTPNYLGKSALFVSLKSIYDEADELIYFLCR